MGVDSTMAETRKVTPCTKDLTVTLTNVRNHLIRLKGLAICHAYFNVGHLGVLSTNTLQTY